MSLAAERTTTDEELMAAYLEGDARAFNELYRRYRSPVLYYTRRFIGPRPELQEDVFQEAFLKLHRSRTRFRQGARFRPWLYTIVHNLCVDRLRRAGIRKEQDFVKEPDDPSPTVNPELTISRTQLRAQLDEALTHVTEKQRACVVLFDIMGHSMAEIAETLNISVSDAKVSVFRGRRKLRTVLKQEAA